MDTEFLEVSRSLLGKTFLAANQHQQWTQSEIAVKSTLYKPVNICFIYIPPCDPINNKKLKLIDQIPNIHILLGDLNSHYMGGGAWKPTKRAQIWRR